MYPTHGEFYMELFIPAFQCPRRMQGIGTLGDGGKWVCSFAINCESPLESTLLKRAPGSGDMTIVSTASCDQWGPEITGDPELRDRVISSPSRSAARGRDGRRRRQ
ncbi:hypothetical protein EDB85DRAFT_150062 [Lactarius pseudohatsudake]|nr:hypothetical protein EDB85DRAFT_150062 [Lactarius pseudohatsudake]